MQKTDVMFIHGVELMCQRRKLNATRYCPKKCMQVRPFHLRIEWFIVTVKLSSRGISDSSSNDHENETIN